MSNRAWCSAIHRRLTRHGVPSHRIERLLVELNEHWEELHEAGLGRGLAQAEAEAEADKLLGEPEQLAAAAINGFRQSSWIGRHPILTMCVLPFLLPPIVMGMVALPVNWMYELTHFVPVGKPGGLLNAQFLCGLLWALNYTAMAGSALWLCWRGWKAGLGFHWVLAIWSWCMLSGMMRIFSADPIRRVVAMGFGFPWHEDTHTPLILLVHGLVAAWMFWIVRRARHFQGPVNKPPPERLA